MANSTNRGELEKLADLIASYRPARSSSCSDTRRESQVSSDLDMSSTERYVVRTPCLSTAFSNSVRKDNADLASLAWGQRPIRSPHQEMVIKRERREMGRLSGFSSVSARFEAAWDTLALAIDPISARPPEVSLLNSVSVSGDRDFFPSTVALRDSISLSCLCCSRSFHFSCSRISRTSSTGRFSRPRASRLSSRSWSIRAS